MTISNRRTVVRSHGSLNKGGTKTIYSYNKEGLSSVKTIRGSMGNKTGGMDNQYNVNTYTVDRPKQSNYKSSGSSRSTGYRSSGAHTRDDNDKFLADLLLGGIITMIAGFFMFFVNLFKSKPRPPE